MSQRRAFLGRTDGGTWWGTLRDMVLITLIKRFNGRGRRGDVLREVWREHGSGFNRTDLQSNTSDGTPNVEKRLEWEVSSMRTEGILKPVAEVGKGIWELTDWAMPEFSEMYGIGSCYGPVTDAHEPSSPPRQS